MENVMGLILQPKFSDKSRDEIEQHIALVRNRRMAAVVQYHTGVNAKLTHVSAKLQQRIDREYYLLGNEIAKGDKIDEVIEKRLAHLETLLQEAHTIREQMVPVDTG